MFRRPEGSKIEVVAHKEEEKEVGIAARIA
jgi:hypothetical protein